MSRKIPGSSSFEKVLESPFSMKEMCTSKFIIKQTYPKPSKCKSHIGKKKLKRKKKSSSHKTTSSLSVKSSNASSISTCTTIEQPKGAINTAHTQSTTLLGKIDSPHLGMSNGTRSKPAHSSTIQALIHSGRSSKGTVGQAKNPSKPTPLLSASFKPSNTSTVSVKLVSRNYSSLSPHKLGTSTRSINPFSRMRESTSSINYDCFSIHDLARGLKSSRFKKIVIMAGAGISTASGIPDFRTPGTGLYDNLQQYRIPEPSAIFDITFFVRNPRPFFTLAKELYPGKYPPNIAHLFIRLLQDKEILLRHYTQNIDGLERLAGIKPNRLVESHGSFATASCTVCQSKHDPIITKESIFGNKIPHCKHKFCKGIVKPDVVFFGEDLPHRFHTLRHSDLSECDLLIVMGTSLEVEPFASLVTSTKYDVPRVLINREAVGPFKHQRKRSKDVVLAGDISDKITELIRLAGWTEQLNQLEVSCAEANKTSSSSSGKINTVRSSNSKSSVFFNGRGRVGGDYDYTRSSKGGASQVCESSTSSDLSLTTTTTSDDIVITSDISQLTLEDNKP